MWRCVPRCVGNEGAVVVFRIMSELCGYFWGSVALHEPYN